MISLAISSAQDGTDSDEDEEEDWGSFDKKVILTSSEWTLTSSALTSRRKICVIFIFQHNPHPSPHLSHHNINQCTTFWTLNILLWSKVALLSPCTCPMPSNYSVIEHDICACVPSLELFSIKMFFTLLYEKRWFKLGFKISTVVGLVGLHLNDSQNISAMVYFSNWCDIDIFWTRVTIATDRIIWT